MKEQFKFPPIYKYATDPKTRLLVSTLLHPGFEIEIQTSEWCVDAQFQNLYISNEGLHLTYKGSFSDNSYSKFVFGWNRLAFPSCCGVDIVHQLNSFSGNNKYLNEFMPTWWEWRSCYRNKPAIGWIPKIQKKDGSLYNGEFGDSFKFFEERGVPLHSGIKNVSYSNHVIIPYLFGRKEVIDAMLNPTVGQVEL